MSILTHSNNSRRESDCCGEKVKNDSRVVMFENEWLEIVAEQLSSDTEAHFVSNWSPFLLSSGWERCLEGMTMFWSGCGADHWGVKECWDGF